jgi:hypothetical protein
MKLKKPLKSASDLRRSGPLKLPAAERAKLLPHQRDAWDRMEQSYQRDQDKKAQAATSPVAANAVGLGYTGPQMPDKGEKDGSCNVTACQMPLAGKPQFWMKNHMTGGRLYYCGRCERRFSDWDREIREPLRCTPDEGNEALLSVER